MVLGKVSGFLIKHQRLLTYLSILLRVNVINALSV